MSFRVALAAFCLATFHYFLGSTIAFEPAPLAIDLNRPISGYRLVNAFPGINFNQPVAIVSAPGETNRLFIVERAGLICVITNLATPNCTVFLDLRTNTYSQSIEGGLLGLAFHPNFQTNGQFFVFRTVGERIFTDRLSRFNVSADDPNRAATNETVLINQLDISDTHNSGDLHFGRDGYLYISVGDDGPTVADRRDLPQAIDGGLFGGILRIDVDQRPGNLPPNAHPSVVGNYSIPADNPFIGATSFLGSPVNPSQVRTEFFAVGMRNPWRFTIDSETGALFAGDVGQGWAEEINLVTSGGNYGWPFWEGFYPGQFTAPNDFQPQWPLHVTERGNTVELGSCVIGGIVCRDISIPQLEGWYVFGDEGSGNIWKMRLEGDGVEWLARESGIVAFGRDPATRDVLVADITRGEIRRLLYTPPEEEHIPTKLSATGIFTNLETLATAPGFVPYDINVPFWSDNALKQRWFGLMNASNKVGFSPTDNWTFPEGAVWVKHFDLEMERGNPATARRVETRLLIKWHDEALGFTYQWDDDGRDATLVGSIGAQQEFTIKDPNGQVRTQTWTFPPRGDCVACHSKGGGGPLGFNTAQLNLDRQTDAGTTENQLTQFQQAGYLQDAQIDPHNLPALAKSADTTQPLEFRVKSYLSANCSQCHRPDGVWGAHWDARWTTPMDQSRIVDAVALPLDTNDWRIIATHSPGTSAMLLRVARRDGFGMPPIGSTVPDENASALLSEWILGLPDADFQQFPIGSGTLAGSVTQRDKTRVISGIGPGMTASAQADRMHLFGGTIGRASQIVAHLSAFNPSQSSAKAGLMIRESADANAATVWFARDATGATTLATRNQENAAVNEISIAAARAWMRLVRNGDKISAWDSADGIIWAKLAETDFVVASDAVAGIAVSSGEDWRYATAEFDELQTLSVGVHLDDPRLGAPLPHDVALQADVITNGVAVARVDFYAQGQFIGSADAPPWRLAWTNAAAGTYPVVATAIDQRGLSISSEALTVTFTALPPTARYIATSPLETNWRDDYAAFGATLPAISTNLPQGVRLNLQGASVAEYDTPGLLDDGDAPLPATAWKSQNQLNISYNPGNELPNRVTLFFAPWENSDDLKITIRNDATGEPLDQRTLSDYAEGRFMSWAVRGDVSFTIESTSGAAAHVSGILLGALPPPTVTMLPVANPIQLPNSILLQADASAEGAQITRVEFWDGNVLLGTVQQAPYEFLWTGALAGEHQVTALAVDEDGVAARSQPITIECSLPKASAAFFGEDRKTQGQWIGIYGNLGNVISCAWTNLPPNFTASVGASSFLFSYPDYGDGSLCVTTDSPDRIASCYFTDTKDPMILNVAAIDGKKARLALYFLDWFGPGRSEQIQLFDPASGEILDQQTVSSFYDGSYFVWNIEGSVRVVIRSLNDYNTIVNALFFDSPERLSSFWFRQNFPKTIETDAKWLEDSDGDGRSNVLEYALGTDPLVADSPLSVTSNGRFLVMDMTGSQMAGDVTISAETSVDLVNWQPVTLTRADSKGHIQLTAPIIETGPHFYRLRVQLL